MSDFVDEDGEMVAEKKTRKPGSWVVFRIEDGAHMLETEAKGIVASSRKEAIRLVDDNNGTPMMAIRAGEYKPLQRTAVETAVKETWQPAAV